MCMGPLMKRNMILRKGRSSITALRLADLSLAALRLTALSLAPLDIEISTRILLLPDKLTSVSRGVRKHEHPSDQGGRDGCGVLNIDMIRLRA